MNEKILKHPCELGLTPECFQKYPVWARQALAYKFLHILLPKQLTKNLPKNLNKPLVAPGVSIPPGVELPPGTVISPDVSFPPGWTPGDTPPEGVIIPPGTVFPPGWTPGDTPPEGVIIPPGTVFPPGWTPGDTPPPGAILPPSVSPTPPESGGSPPIYTQIWEPGPIKGTAGINPSPSVLGSLLVSNTSPKGTVGLQGPPEVYTIIAPIPINTDAKITHVDFLLYKFGKPNHSLSCEIWEKDPITGETDILPGGDSIPIEASTIPDYAEPRKYTMFQFQETPTIKSSKEYGFALSYAGIYDPDTIIYISWGTQTSVDWELWWNAGEVTIATHPPPCHKIYGYPE